MYKEIRVLLITLGLMSISLSGYSEGGQSLLEACLEEYNCKGKAETELSCKGNIRHAVSGKQTRTATCSGNGWEYSEWAGECECSEPYEWNGLFCQLKAVPEIKVKCVSFPEDSGYKNHTLIGLEAKELLKANISVEVEIRGDFKKGEEYYSSWKDLTILMMVGEKVEKIREFDIGLPQECEEEKVCNYIACTATIKEAKWVNI